ncbi:MAG: hypothetical protein ACLQNE_42920 [Thermoguttaceae bacterium]
MHHKLGREPKFFAPAVRAKGLYLKDKPAVSRDCGAATSGVRWCFGILSFVIHHLLGGELF